MARHIVEFAPQQEVFLQPPSIKKVDPQPECSAGNPLGIVAGGSKAILNPAAIEVERSNQYQAEDADSANRHDSSPDIDIHDGLAPTGIGDHSRVLAVLF
jgi:hypothetical protein